MVGVWSGGFIRLPHPLLHCPWVLKLPTGMWMSRCAYASASADQRQHPTETYNIILRLPTSHRTGLDRIIWTGMRPEESQRMEVIHPLQHSSQLRGGMPSRPYGEGGG